MTKIIFGNSDIHSTSLNIAMFNQTFQEKMTLIYNTRSNEKRTTNQLFRDRIIACHESITNFSEQFLLLHFTRYSQKINLIFLFPM